MIVCILYYVFYGDLFELKANIFHRIRLDCIHCNSFGWHTLTIFHHYLDLSLTLNSQHLMSSHCDFWSPQANLLTPCTNHTVDRWIMLPPPCSLYPLYHSQNHRFMFTPLLWMELLWDGSDLYNYSKAIRQACADDIMVASSVQKHLINVRSVVNKAYIINDSEIWLS